MAAAAGRGGRTPLSRHVEAYLDHLRVERGLARNTVAAYARDLDRYADHLAGLGVSDPAAVTMDHVHAFASVLRTGDGDHPPLAASSVARSVVAVRGLHRFWLAERVAPIDVSRDVAPPQPGRRLPKALSVAQVSAILAAVSVPDPSPGDLCDAALLELLYGTGARISEVVELDVDDLTRALADPESGLRLLGKGGKERIVPLGSYARLAVDAWLVRGRPALATRTVRATPALLLNARGTRLSRQSAFNRVRAAAEKAGIGVEISPHTLRHSYATHLLDGGADVRVVQELLGHASVATTQVYTLVTIDHLREVYAEAHPRAR
jgi:integrase/recombinase XerD